jgi:hypothetical protein
MAVPHQDDRFRAIWRGIQAVSNGGTAHERVLLGRQMVPVFDQRQVLLDFLFDKSQSGLKLFLARELEACLVVLRVAVVGSD